VSDETGNPGRTIVPTIDQRRSYTLEAIQSLYIFCSDPVEKFSERYKISPTLVEAYVREGRWNELRAAHTEKALEIFRTAVTGQIEDSLDLELKWQSIRNIQSEQQFEVFAKYFQKHGDLWARNPQTDEVLNDHLGFPIPLKIPASFKLAHELIAGLQAKLGQLIQEQKALEDAKASEGGIKGGVINVSDYRHLLAPKKKDGS
jgi:hypothetical protein